MKYIILLITFIICTSCFSQCENSNFEYGDFTNWQGRRGACCPINLPTTGILNGRQTIMTQGFDPHTCGNLNMVYQGTYSARLGNDGVGSRAEGLYYTFTVSPASNLIQYAYAVVMQDPGHGNGEQPRFQSRVSLQDGSIIPCTEYFVSAGPDLEGYQYCDEFDIFGNAVQIAYSDWRVVSLDLSSYIGQVVTLEFETGDCDFGAHFGYAYIDAISCGPIETTIYYCSVTDSLLIEAPSGFDNYSWIPTGDTTQVITVESNVYDTLWVDVITATGCPLQLEIILSPYGLLADIICENVCLGNSVTFTNLTSLISDYNLVFEWDFGNGDTSSEYSPTYTYDAAGTYIVNLNVDVEETSCVDEIECELEIYDIPLTPLIILHD